MSSQSKSKLKSNKKRVAEGDLEDAAPTTSKKVLPRETPTGIANVLGASQVFLSEVLNVFRGAHQPYLAADEISLPLPPIKFVQIARFHNSIRHRRLLCIHREAFGTLHQALSAKAGFYYLNGPSGMGKSFALYFLYCQLSATPKTRVIYINDCITLRYNKLNLFRAAAAAFANDADCLKTMIKHAKQNDWQSMLIALAAYCKTNNLTLWAIFDEHNKIPVTERKGMLNMNYLWALLHFDHCHVVVSASASNEDEGAADEWLRNTTVSVPFNSGFTDAEFKMWCRSHAVFLPPNFPPLPQPLTAADDATLNDLLTLIKPVTDLIPLELDILKREDLSFSVGDRLRYYALKRIADMEKEFCEFKNIKVVSPYQKRSFYNACSALLTKTPTDDPIRLDKRIMFAVPTNNPLCHSYILPVPPLAMQAVMNCTSTADMSEWAGTALEDSRLTNDAKGRIVALYLVHVIAQTRLVNLPLRFIVDEQKQINRDLALENLHVEYIVGNGAPPSAPSQSTLYIPYNSNYPDADFFIWNHDTRRLFVVQVTMRADPQNHSHTWSSGSGHFDAWKTLLNTLFANKYEEGESWHQKVWITRAPPTCKKFKHHLFLDISDEYFRPKLEQGPYKLLLNFVAQQ